MLLRQHTSHGTCRHFSQIVGHELTLSFVQPFSSGTPSRTLATHAVENIAKRRDCILSKAHVLIINDGLEEGRGG